MTTKLKIEPGDFVTCRHEVSAYDSGHGGRPEVWFRPGMVGRVSAITPKVRIAGEPPIYDKKPEFLVVDFFCEETGRPERVGLNFCNAVRQPSTTGSLLVARRNLAVDCVALKERLMRAGLYRTGQKMEAVVTEIGWEIAEQIEKEMKEGHRDAD